MISTVHDAEMSQARNLIQKLSAEREVWIRLSAILAKGILNGSKFGVVDGQISVTREQYDAVPKAWSVSAFAARVKPDSDDPNAPDQDVLVVSVKDREEASRLVVANGAV